MRLEEQQYKRMFMTEEEHSILIENTERYTEWKNLKIDNGSRRAYCCNKEMNISPKAYKILEFLKDLLVMRLSIKIVKIYRYNLNKTLTKNIFTIYSNKLLFV